MGFQKTGKTTTINVGKPKFEESSGNVFADIGLKNPEKHLAEAELAHKNKKKVK